MRVELGLAWAGIRHRPGPWILLSAGVALATMLPLVAAGMRTEAAVAAVETAVQEVPPPSRTVLAVTGKDLRGAALEKVDSVVRDGFGAAGVLSPVGSLTFRPLSLAGQDVTLGAMDRLDSVTRLTAGRLPASCTPTRCEVLQVRPPGADSHLDAAAANAARRLGLSITGTADLSDQRLVGVGLVNGDLPLLLGAEPSKIADLDALTLRFRTIAWFGTLDGATVAAQGVSRFSRTLAGIADTVNAASGPLSVSWPIETVTAAAERANSSAERFAVLGVGAGALQLGFCLVVAAGLRPRQQLVGRLLSRRGGSPGQILLSTALQPAIVVPVGVLVGLGLGGALVAVRARGVLRDPLSTTLAAGAATWPVLAGLALAAVAIVLAIASWPAEAGRAGNWLLNSALVAAVGVPVLALTGLPGGAAGPLPISAIVSLVVAVGLVAARLWTPLLALAARLLPGRAGRRFSGVVAQVAVLVSRRRPLLGMATAGFFAAACCSLVFASGYQGSLRQSALDQAAAQVPLDVRVGPSSRVSVPLDVLDSERLRKVSPQVAIHPVVASPVTAFPGTTRTTVLPLTGIDPSALPAMHEFTATTGSTLPATALAARLSAGQPVKAPAPVIPAGVDRIAVHAAGMSSDITLNLWLSTAEGRERQVQLTGNGPDLTARIDPGAAHIVRAVEIAESASNLDRRQHAIGEGTTDKELPTGDLVLGPVTAAGAQLAWIWTGWGSNQAKVSSAGTTDSDTIRVHYQISDARVVLTPGYNPPSAAAPIPVAVDPGTAARAGDAGAFGISVNGVTVPVRIVAVLTRLPGVGSSFLLADRTAVVALLDSTAPGTAAVSQVWIAAPGAALEGVRAALQSSPAAAATLRYRADLARSLAEDPVATRSITLLTIAGVMALSLAMVATAAAVRADLAQTAADAYALELDGLTTPHLRLISVVRAAFILLAGVPLGVLGGLLLTTVAVRLLVTGPGGAAVEPPLRVVFGALPTLLVVAAATLGGVLAAGMAVATALRRKLPHEPEVDLR
jgi:hypothetical protein